jgi:MarR family 2-MHQ and catechol resistance regulon transcriptional repressor
MPPADPNHTRALRAYIALMRAADAITLRAHQHLADHDLTLAQFGVLEALCSLGAMRQHELADRVLRSPGNMTKVIDTLEARALVKRVRESEDRRCITVHATAKGRKLVEAILPRHAAGMAEEFSPLSAGEQEEFFRLCRALEKAHNRDKP